MQSNEFLEQLTKLMGQYIANDTTRGHRYQPPEQPLSVDISLDQTQGVHDEQFRSLLENILEQIPPTTNTTFFNQLFGGRLLPGLAGDILASVTNNSLYTYKASGILTHIEQEVINAMLQQIGYTQGDGIFTPSGSLSNMTGIMHAAHAKISSFKSQGREGSTYTLYTSANSHYSIKKFAGLLGMGTANVREIPTDNYKRIDCDLLKETLQNDRENGAIPLMINATAGTTVRGSFDNIQQIAQLAEEYNCWLHVDASRGGTTLLHPDHAHKVTGIECADSVARNPHKMMGLPLTVSGFFVKQKEHLHKTMSTEADYLFQTEKDQYNHGKKHLQCGRVNNAFKVRCAWKYLGKEGYQQRIAQQFTVRDRALGRIAEEEHLTLLLQPELLNVCFTVAGIDNEQLCTELDRRGLIKVASGTDQNRSFVRMTCTNPDLSKEDIDYFFDTVLEVAHDMKRSNSGIRMSVSQETETTK